MVPPNRSEADVAAWLVSATGAPGDVADAVREQARLRSKSKDFLSDWKKGMPWHCWK